MVMSDILHVDSLLVGFYQNMAESKNNVRVI